MRFLLLTDMAARSSLYPCVFLVVLLPTLAICYRPFRVPRNLFVHGTSPFTLPEGAREIRWEDDAETLRTLEEYPLEDMQLQGHLRSRFRRESPVKRPGPEKVTQFLAKDFDTLYMYWPRNSKSEDNVFLLAKNTKPSGDKSISKVYVSRNYGKNFTEVPFGSKTPGKASLVDQIYSSKADPKLCILADKKNKVLYHSENLSNFTAISVAFETSFITFHPLNRKYALAYDSTREKLYWSNTMGKTFTEIRGKIKSFHWGIENIDSEDSIYVESYQADRDTTKNNKTTIYRLVDGNNWSQIAENVEEFEVMKNFMFITTRKTPSDKNPILKVAKMVKGAPITFGEAQFPSNEESRDFFVFDVNEGFVFIVINHLKNLSSLYVSDTTGLKYQLSLPRVLYHNPYTDVSSPWLRTVIPYAFVDVDKIKAMRGIYVATQLTPGPVGKRHLLTLMTYNRGATWQRARAPAVDNRGSRINCYLPSCSLHFNLQYGAVYRVSPSERLFSSTSAPGLVLSLGVASTNLKIYPDLYMSLDGGVGWSRVLRGKYLFTFGDHGGAIIAVPFRRFTRTLWYSTNGGATWQAYLFSNSLILARDVVTQPGEKLPVFLIYGTSGGRGGKPWSVFFINMTSLLGPRCDSTGFTNWTDGCLLGRQQQFETRNWTVQCLTSRDYRRPIFLQNCKCTRDDFQCDYGFQKKQIDEDCAPIRQGEDLNHNIVPENCPEGTNYSRTRGFRKIPGDTCEGGTEEDFSPVSTPCPIKELANLSLNCSSVNKDGLAAVATGQTASFNAVIGKGHYPNINLKWFFGDGHDESGSANNHANTTHKYDKPGKYVVSVVASNARSILVKRLDIHVQDKLDETQMSVNYKPEIPGVDEDVIFSASLNYSNEQVGNVKYKWKYDEGEIYTWQPIATLQFKSSKTYNVSVTAKNYVSKVKKVVQVKVVKDLTPLNVVAKGLGPSKILVKWDAPVHADRFLKGYKVSQSTTGFSSFAASLCEAPSKLSCTVIKLKPATVYYFRVQAYTASGATGPFSEIAFARTNTSVPGAPLKLRAFPISPSVISVQWQSPVYPNGRITNYMIAYWSAEDLATIKRVNNGPALSRNFTGLLQDTYYFFKVYAQSTAGQSKEAGPVQALTRLSKPTQPPREVRKVSDNGTCAVLTWKAPQLTAKDERVFPAKGYKVQVNNNSPVDAATAFKIVCRLQPGKSYVVKIWAYSSAGDGPKATFTLSTETLKPGVPRNLRCSSSKAPDRVTLEWDDPSQNSAGITGYEIHQVNPYIAKPYVTNADESKRYTISTLRPYTSYTFSISARNSVGSSARSRTVTCKTSEDSPGIVEFVTSQTIEPKSATIQVTWSAPDKPNGVIKNYKIRWGKVYGPNPQELMLSGSTHQYTFKNLFSSTEYSFIVIPINGAGPALQYEAPSIERTFPALKNTERLRLEYSGASMDGERAENFIPAFVKAASKRAGILDLRLAAVVVKGDSQVEFDLIPPLNASGVSMEKVKSSLNGGFKASEWTLNKDSLHRLFVYDGTDSAPSPTQQKQVSTQRKQVNTQRKQVTAGALMGNSSNSSSKKTYLAIAVPLAIIGIVLLGGLIFYYMKYKSLAKHYGQMSVERHEEDEMKIVYHGDMEADSPDVIFSDRSRKGKKFFKDSEKVPLGDQDELSMV